MDDIGQNAISVRWVMTEKLVHKKPCVKARLVARGFEEDMEFQKDSPTCSKEAVRIVLAVLIALAIAATNDWNCHTMDVKAAYLQGDLIEKVVHLRPPTFYGI